MTKNIFIQKMTKKIIKKQIKKVPKITIKGGKCDKIIRK